MKNNDILMCKDGALTGKVCFVDDKILPQIEVMVNEHVYIFRGKPNIIHLFILLFK
ncbi:hypothetical protein APHACPA_0316 [Rickettsia amblyommatis str. Ac/Pa]|uniref:Type I restriction modification DNA specificity domain protein n=1 Tax=Rickettsia amblyommatis str. Ac/Pa TaxID=1359164 RepID=A0A0F3N0T9_RICAM|nr:hypothetical protein APHACPA_0316 [Rickettsia amblyommatis str. Ac/Pa]